MRKLSLQNKVSFLAVFLLVFLAYTSVFSSQKNITYEAPAKFSITPATVDVSATAYAVFDAETSEIFLTKEENKVLPIASITKLIAATALVQGVDLATQGKVATEDVLAEGQAGKLTAGDTYEYRELLFPLLLESSNDAAAFFQRETKGEIIKQMNDLTQRVGMKETKLVDASGLSDSNISTVRDLITFLTYLAEEEQYVLDITRLKQYVGPYRGSLNNNPVLSKNYLGGKHGYTLAANRTVVALFSEEFSTGNRTVGYVLLGSSDLAKDMEALRSFVANSITFE